MSIKNSIILFFTLFFISSNIYSSTSWDQINQKNSTTINNNSEVWCNKSNRTPFRVYKNSCPWGYKKLVDH